MLRCSRTSFGISVRPEIDRLAGTKQLDPKERLDGQGTFDVAKDARRPFVVLTHSLSATAVGTKFRVTTGSDVEVEVLEGVVIVSPLRGGKAAGMANRLEAGGFYTSRISR